jgi:uncharacterized protein affecting Mg2+/Co2+ transport
VTDNEEYRQLIPISSSIKAMRPFVLHLRTGRVYMCGITHPVAATPASDHPENSVLEWYEEFGRRLRDGYFGPDPSHGGREPVAHYHNLPRSITNRQFSDVVTRAVRVTFSASLTDASQRDGVQVMDWSYSLAFSLLSEEEQVGLRPEDRLVSVQLKSRHWRMKNDDGSVEAVDGPGVIGEYPILAIGDEDPFVYQSRTVCKYGGEEVPSMHGHFRFVEGTIDDPTGDEFNVTCGEIFFDGEPGFLY